MQDTGRLQQCYKTTGQSEFRVNGCTHCTFPDPNPGLSTWADLYRNIPPPLRGHLFPPSFIILSLPHIHLSIIHWMENEAPNTARISTSVIQIRLVVFKSGSWYSNSSRGIQIRLVVFKFDSWHSNSSRGGQIRLSGIQICLSFKVNSLRQYCG